MKKILLVPFAIMIVAGLIVVGCGGGGGGGTTITPDQGAEYLGQEVTVCGPCVMVDYDVMAPIDPKPLILIMGKLGGAEDFGSTNFMPGNMGFRLYEEVHPQLTNEGQEYVGKELCITVTVEETPVGTIGGPITDLSQIVVK
jgi:hypothetical protein